MKILIFGLLISIVVSIFTSEDFELEIAKVLRVPAFVNETKGERR